MIKVLIADDQPVVRGGVRMILEAESDMVVAGEAGDGLEAVERARLLRPDVVLMDVRMPGIDGLEATRRLLAGDGGPSVLVLTTFDLDEYVYEALRAGASGFLLKSAPPERILDAIRTVAAGGALLAPEVTRRLIEQFVRHPRPTGGRPPETEELTEWELEVLKLIAARPFQRGDRRQPVRKRGDRQDPREPRPPQARATRPRPSGRVRLRVGAGATRRSLGRPPPSPRGSRTSYGRPALSLTGRSVPGGSSRWSLRIGNSDAGHCRQPREKQTRGTPPRQ